MKRALALCVLAAAVAAVAAAPASAVSGIKLTPVRSKFPERSYILSLPQRISLGTRDVTVLEGGKPVKDVAISSTRAAVDQDFATVLVIDASNSMRGTPLNQAYAAARMFASRRNTNQPLGIVTFDGQVTRTLAITTDAGKIRSALANVPATGEGTRIYDGIVGGISMLRDSHVASGSIVLLSDGADTGSRTRVEAALAQARDLHIRVFSVGLDSPQFDATALNQIAAQTGGTFSEAKTAADLTRIYNSLGYRLANEYLLQYKSFANPSQRVVVTVSVAGIKGHGAAAYRSPALPLVLPPAIHKSVLDKVLQSPITMLVIVALIAILLGFAATAAYRPTSSQLRRRIGAFVSVRDPEVTESADIANPVNELSATPSAWERFRRDVEIAEITVAPAQIAIITLLGTLLAVWIGSLINVLLAFVALFIPFAVRMLVKNLADRKKREFGDQLPDNLQVLASALRAGHSLIGALSVVVEDAPEPSRREFRQVVADEQVGVPLDDALRRVAIRMSNRDLEQVALVAAMQRETGGGAAEVLDRVAETVRDRAALRRLVRVLTAQGRMARWIVSGLPIALLLVISVLNNQYMKPMFTKTLGQGMVAVAALMVVAGSLVIRKIVDIKV